MDYDFEYAGRWLSDFGYMICTFNMNAGAETAQSGSKITFNKVPVNGGRHHSLTGIQYDECLSTTFNICKDPDCGRWGDNYFITDMEYQDLLRWLNRPQFLKFRLVNYEDYSVRRCYFNASFNINKVVLNTKTIGLELSMETDAPFGYGDDETVTITQQDIRYDKDIYIISDELGFVYPSLEITCAEAGDLTIKNKTDDVTMTIRNCSEDETIFINGKTFEITSSNEEHKLSKDFNFIFLRLHNDYEGTANVLSFSIPCIMKVTYTPIIKSTPF